MSSSLFIINCKNYNEIAGLKFERFVKIVEQVSRKYKTKITVAPPNHLLSTAVKSSVPILAQHVDNVKIGSTTGFLVPDILKQSKIKGAIINHSEHRIPSKDIKDLVARLRKLRMLSIVCVKNVVEARKYARLNPDYVAIEPPELIGSGKAVSKERPELITKAVAAVRSSKTTTKLLCGAGLVSGEDVRLAIKLGAKGILVASGIVKAKNWNKIIAEFAKAML